MTNFDSTQHPRTAAGTSKGGQFAPKSNSTPEAALASAALTSEEEFLAAVRLETEMASQMREMSKKRSRMAAKMVATVVRERYPNATCIEFVGCTDWDTPEGEVSGFEFTAIWDGSTKLAESDEIENTIKVFGGQTLNDNGAYLFGYEFDSWQELFDVEERDGDVEAGIYRFSIDLEKFLDGQNPKK